MSASDNIIIAFDLYGTLLSTESISSQLASHFGDERAQSIASLWRRYQLEYTWRMNSMSLYKPFSQITHLSLLHALSETSSTLTPTEITSLMNSYDSLSTFPDVPPALQSLLTTPAITAYVFSNGTNSMVSTSVQKSPSLSPYASVFKDLITVEEIEVFKPDPRVYHYLAKKVGKSTSKEDLETVWLVSGNPFDVVGARAAGIQATWVDRAGGHHGVGGWNDKLGELANGGPTIIVKGVDEAVREIKKWTEEHGKSTK